MEEEFEVRGAHEAAVEHAAEKHVSLGQEVALFSAVLATLGAIRELSWRTYAERRALLQE